MDFIKNKKVLALAGIALIIIGVFFPFSTFTSFIYNMSYSFIGISVTRTMFLYFFCTVAGLFFFREFLNKKIPSLFNNSFGKKILNANELFGLIPVGMCAVFVGYVSLKLLKVTDGEYVNYGFGFYVLWLGIICLAVQAILPLIKTNNVANNNSVVKTPSNVTPEAPVTSAEPAVSETPVQAESAPVANPTSATTENPNVQNVASNIEKTAAPVMPEAQVAQTEPVVPETPVQAVNPSPQDKVCPNCGTKVDTNTSFCTNCGNKI